MLQFLHLRLKFDWIFKLQFICFKALFYDLVFKLHLSQLRVRGQGPRPCLLFSEYIPKCVQTTIPSNTCGLCGHVDLSADSLKKNF